ncbi:ankyrin repeat protein [Xylariales sp. PMI_506]|nr:ankyrin repeat protein [Xylariales sp. PMI_506]
MESNAQMDATPIQHQPDDYSIAIICPMGVELAPVIAMLDETHQHVPTSRDQNTYTLGRIADHNVVLAVMPEIGNNPAAIVVTQLVNDFQHIRFALLVGIGGGIPDEDYDDEPIDIRLGDVVVSKPDKTFGGVVQFDSGKMNANQQFQRTGTLNKPPPVLSGAVQKLVALHKVQGNGIAKHLAQMLEKNPYMEEEYDFPGTENDRLFKASYPHTSGKKTCRQCDTDHTITRIQRKNGGPRIHYGTIGSSNLVIKDSTTRDQLREELGILCVEMEAAGLVDAFPCLVIRGICDYADSHKNKKWQPYAAATAAAYAKELLEHIPPSEVKRTPTIEKLKDMINERFSEVNAKLDGIHSSASEAKIGVEVLKVDSHYQKLINWLSPPDPSTNFNKALKQRHTDSGQWFLRSSAYKAWEKDRSSFLWLNGIPGCGKTILSSTVVKNLQESKACDSLLYFYFDFSDAQKQSLENLVCSLLDQLYRKKENARKDLDSLYSSCEKGRRRPSIESLCATLSNMIQQAGEVWIVLDALDECQTRKEYLAGGILSWLQSLRDSHLNVHLLVTSRPEQDIQKTIEKWARKEDIIPLRDGLIGDDIRAYIKARVRNSEGLGRWKTRPDIQEKIEATLIEKAKGMFRWVSCQFDVLETCLSPQEVQKALVNLPETLDDTYARILKNIPSGHRHYAKRILQFLSFSERPLRIDEAVDVIAVDITSRPRFDPENRIPVPAEISRYCSSLVVIVTRKRSFDDDDYWSVEKEKPITEIQLAHFSVKEYLTSDRLRESVANDFEKDFEESTARASIAEVCLSYQLNLARINQTYSLDQIESLYPLAKYSARYWASHAMIAETYSKTSLTLAMELFFNQTSFEICCQLYSPDRYSQKNQSTLYYASSMGLFYSVQELIHKGADVNAQGGHYGNALQAASSRGHEAVVQLLLEKGADVNAQGGNYGNALQAASERGYEAVVQLLLEKGADINAQGGHYGNALQAASDRGYEAVVQLLLEKGADINAQGGRYGNALRAASNRGHKAVVQLLLEKGADVNAQSGHYVNALQAASEGGYKAVVQLLLEKGADVNAQGGRYANALQAASEGGHKAVVQLLLEKGADVNAQSGRYANALQAASEGGHKAVVQLLFEKGADINAQGGYYGSAFQAASGRGHKAVVQLLLEKGADVNAQGGGYGNALQAASDGGHKAVVQLLLEKGADINAQGGDYGNALQAASSRGHEAVVQLLLEKGADINAQGGYYGSALQAASGRGHKAVVQLLLEKGADVNAQGGGYGNALQAASDGGHKAVVQLLLEKGADINAQGGDYGNALQAASSRGHEAVVQLLLEKGADINAQGGYYGSALQAASDGGHKAVVQLLLEKGADINAQGGDYGNALQAASEGGHKAVVQLLLEKGADVNAQGGDYGNALQAASNRGHEAVVQLLLEKGADINAQGGRYGNALQAASSRDHEAVVQLLLEKGADINAQGGRYGSALQAASSRGHEAVVQLLLEKGANW